ncbi:hypothetical protein GQ44DRAFT_606812 [Phaeosphaeriaceae sp. PMI808]|nr:hypothetical protein GQ44DRAFT_606812 [Phaeosphaeriaceae sp. PMI808]
MKDTPPVSESSSEILHGLGSPDIRSNFGEASSINSSFSPDSLSFDRLAIDSGSAFARGGVPRYTTPYQRGIQSRRDNNRLSNSSSDFVRRDGNFRAESPFSNRRRGGGYRNSNKWISPDAQTMQDFMIIRNSMRRQFKKSDVAQWSYSDYIAHREAMVASEAKQLANKVKAKVDALTSPVPPISVETQQSLNKWGIFGNFEESGNFSRVLGEPTIWCQDWTCGKSEIAPWPSISEMKWEGDDRAKTNVGRFLPLPREEGVPGFPWNQLSCIEQYPLDQVARVPTMEDVYLPVDNDIEEQMTYLWSKSLENAMDDLHDI